LDAVCHDFKGVLLEDCTASFSESIHEQTLNIYRRNPLYPLLKIVSSSELVAELS
jgi:isochorismate hydrolase